VERTGTEELVKSAFACACGDVNKRRMKARHDWYVRNDKPGRGAKDGDPFYATRLLYALEEMTARIEGIYFDQWGMMAIETQKTPNYEGPAVRISMQFDRFEDGLVYAYRILYKIYGGDRKYIETDDE
jgi:hypothetical protein